MSELQNLVTTFSILLILLAGNDKLIIHCDPDHLLILSSLHNYIIIVMWVLYAGFL